MTNYERWNLMMRDCVSPQSYIDFGFHYMIGAALQRRVWMGDTSPNIPGQMFSNTYTILVGPPATGKGRVIEKVDEMLKHWRVDLASGKTVEPTLDNDSDLDKPYLLPCGPSNTTYEAIVKKLATHIRRIANPDPLGTPKVYSHSSLYFCLEELTSLFQHDTKKIADLLLQTYDCKEYTRETKTAGNDGIKKPCVGILAGTTVDALAEVFSHKILGDGMASRIWFIYESVPRFRKWEFNGLDEEQRQCKKDLLLHLEKLGHCYGRVVFSPEADEFLKPWWEEITIAIERPNNNIRLDTYYGRKILHLKKLCVSMLFGEHSDKYVIPLEIAVRALTTLNEVEKRMHIALDFGGRNPLAPVAKRVIYYLANTKREVSFNELLAEFGSDLRELELVEVLRGLMSTGKLVYDKQKYRIADNLKGAFGKTEVKIDPGSLKALPLPESMLEEGDSSNIINLAP